MEVDIVVGVVELVVGIVVAVVEMVVDNVVVVAELMGDVMAVEVAGIVGDIGRLLHSCIFDWSFKMSCRDYGKREGGASEGEKMQRRHKDTVLVRVAFEQDNQVEFDWDNCIVHI